MGGSRRGGRRKTTWAAWLGKLPGRLRCRLGYHRRSRSKRRKTDSGYASTCTHCGIAMERTSSGRWKVI